jgi:MFS family permease
VSNALIADIASERNLGVAMGVFGTVWDIGEAAEPIIAGFLIGRLGYAPTFNVSVMLHMRMGRAPSAPAVGWLRA